MKKKIYTLLILAFFSFILPTNAQNNALDFDGTDDYLTTSGYMNLSFQSFAIEGWFKADALPSAGNYPHIFGIMEAGSDAAFVRINGDSKKLEFIMNSSAGLKWVTSPETIQIGVWYHAAILYHKGGTDAQYLLINGKVVASQAFATVNNYSNREFRIGGDGSRNFNGQVDDVKVWSNFYQSSQGVRETMYEELTGNESNLVAYYKLDETSGTTANDSQSSSTYDGTLSNMTGNEWTTSSAFFGPKNCLNFDGADDNVWCPSITPTVTSGSIEFWVNLDVIPADNARLISRHSSYGYDEIYLINNNGRIATGGSFVVGDDLLSNDPLPTDVWTHVAITADGSGSKLYINGNLDDTGGAADFDFNTFRFGGQYTAGFWECIDGMMDEVRLWNDVRTESEIRESMFKSLVGDEANLVAYYNLDNIYGTVAQSYPAEANDGSIGGGATWVSSSAFDTWLDTDDNDWATASNWSNGIPGSTDNIGIYNLSGNDPSVSSTASCNDLYLESGATMSLNDGASFINSGNLYFNGDFIYNKTLTNDGKWHIISAPNNNTTANLFFGDYLQNWNESTGLWEQIDDENTTLTPVKGYGFYGTHAKASYSFVGDPNDGNQSISLTTSGSGGSFNKANAVGNPYPSSIDWDLVEGYGAKYTWNEIAYEAYPATGGFGTGPRYAAPCQGFFVLPDNSGTFSLNNTMRTHSGANGFDKSNQSLINGLLVYTNSADYNDKLIIAFNEDSSEDFELDKDAYKVLSNTENLSQIYSLSNIDKLSIDIRPESEIVQLGFQNTANGKYSIGVLQSDGIANAELEDTKLNIFHDLSIGVYEFDWLTSDSEERFVLHLKATGTDEINKITQIFAFHKTINIRSSEKLNRAQISIIDMMGRTVYEQTLLDGQNESINLPLEDGVYLVQLVSDSGTQEEKVILQ